MASLTVTDRFKYDVFLSFRGEDTRHGFTGNLWKALDDKGVRTFIDDEELQKGNEITESLLNAIEDSNMAIVVLSENYASSSFCLQELSKILDSINNKGRCVHPVFYKVDPSEAMAKHEEASPSSHDVNNKWKDSLHQVANLSGSHYKGDEYEHKFIKKIVEQVLRNIKPIVFPVGDYLAGLEHQKQLVISLLNVGSDDTIHMVGIHGIGGIGKTTLALEVYNSIVHQFDCSCFFENVREKFDKKGLIYLQKTVLSQIVGEMNTKITSVGQGILIFQKMLPRKKVLLLLDDVDKDEQLKAIAGSSNWFGPGSRVIITTRDKRLLTNHGVEKIYEVKVLNDEDAFDLVRWKALKNSYSPSFKDVLLEETYGRELNVNELSRPKDSKNDKDFSGYANVLKRAVAYASGLPLALEVIGSHFFNKTIEQCKDALDRCERVPDKKIQMTLQLSFGTLQEDEQCVFLDIACCLKGFILSRVEEILHAHYGYSMKDHINVLEEKSLIKISNHIVKLHDLIEDMGKEIVRQESIEDPGKRSRLWAYKDLKKIFEENTGTSNVKIIHFQFNPWIENKWENWDGKAFKKMKNLKTLIFSSPVRFSEKFEHIPNSSLRVLEYSNPNGYHFQNPFEWKGFLTKKFENMRVLNLYHTEGLKQIPDISSLPNLEKFTILCCNNLIAIDKSIGFLGKLKILRFIHCNCLRKIPPLKLDSLETLEISCCYSLESFPLVVDVFLGKLIALFVNSCKNLRSIPPLKLDSLKTLHISDCDSLERFPLVVDGFLGRLKTLFVRKCQNLKSIPPLKLDLLETLDISSCDSLESFPLVVDGFLGKLKSLTITGCLHLRSIPPLKLDLLETLDISNCHRLESFPIVVDGFQGKLKALSVNSCSNLRSIPPFKFDSLEELKLSDCLRLESFPIVVDEFLGKLKTMVVTKCCLLRSIPPLNLDSLEELELSFCSSLENFPPMMDGFLGKLKTLCIDDCHRLWSIPPLKLDSLETLYISSCNSLESFPLVVDGFLGKLKTLVVKDCRNLRSIPPLKLDSLEKLDISNCNSLESFPLVVDVFLGKLKTMVVRKCKYLRSIPPLKLDSLETLDISSCDSLESFPLVVDGFLGKLKTLFVRECQNLRSIPPLKLNSLETLDISFCDSLESFPLVVDGFLGKLKSLFVRECQNLRSIPPLKLDSLETLDISFCDSLESFPLVVDGFLGKLKSLFVRECQNLRSIPPLKLDSLETLDISFCDSLESFPLVVDGFLGKLKSMVVRECPNLRSIPPLKLDSLETLDISFCDRLESFPLVVDGFLGKLKSLAITDCYHLKSIPPLKLDSLESLVISSCHSLESFPLVVDGFLGKLKTLLVSNCHNIRSIPPLKLDSLEELDLSSCYSLESFPLVVEGLWKLVLDDCKELQEIKVIPPCLRMLSALNCMSLTSSCKSKLLNQELHKAGNTWFRLPQAKVPEWFDHQWSAGLSISFWFRNKFPAIALCVLSPLIWDGSPLRVIINGDTFFYTHSSEIGAKSHADTYHLHLIHMQMENFNDNMDKALSENKWNHAQVDFGFEFQKSGIHVLKEKSSMKDIRFTNSENDANIVFTPDEVEESLISQSFEETNVDQTDLDESDNNLSSLV